VRKRLLTVSLAKSRYIAEPVLKIYEQFIVGDMHYINKSFEKNVKKSDALAQAVNSTYLLHGAESFLRS
jgi:hypothetical protein